MPACYFVVLLTFMFFAIIFFIEYLGPDLNYYRGINLNELFMNGLTYCKTCSANIW